MIWKVKPELEVVNSFNKNTLMEHLNIVVSEIGDDFLKATMPVNSATSQPFGLLHGGASVVLAESLGSMASSMIIDIEHQKCVGLSINANHLKGVKKGNLVTGIAKPIHLGRKTHVWEINIYNIEKDLVCVSRLTMAII